MSIGPRATAAFLVVLALGLPAAAHVDDVPNRAVWSFGPFIAVLTPEGVPYAGHSTNWSLEILTGPGTFQPPSGTRVTITTSMGNASVVATAVPGAHGAWRANWTSPQPGTWRATVEISGPARGKGSANITIYPDLGYRILASADNPTTNAVNRISFRSEPAGRDVPNLHLVVERWKPGGERGLDASPISLIRDGPGRWHAAAAFPEVGWFHLVLSSREFAAGEMPVQRLEVTAGPAHAGLDANGWRIVAVLGAVVLWLGMAARRR